MLTIKEICEAVNGICHNIDIDTPIYSISFDSREEQKGLFVALLDARDGHDFIASAIERGAVCALASDPEKVHGLPAILVSDTGRALLDLGRYCRDKFSGHLVAVTGSVGKTTTKELIAHVFSESLETLKTQGSFNNYIGLPITLFGLKPDTEAAIIELGMNHRGEIETLAAVARPTAAVFTNIGDSHIENLGSRDGIMHAKAELLPFLPEGGTVILNGSDEYLLKMEYEYRHLPLRFIRAGFTENCAFRCVDIKPDGLTGIYFTIVYNNWAYPFYCPAPGRHMALNCCIAFALATVYGIGYEQVKHAFTTFSAAKMRQNITEIPWKSGKLTLINDAYNSSPVSVSAALDVLQNAEGRKAAIFGDMLELGEDAKRLHFETGANAAWLDLLICIGELSVDTCTGAKMNGCKRVFHADTAESAKALLKRELKAGDTVLLKASRGMKFEKIAEYLSGKDINNVRGEK